jgi:anti-sigma factor RsiW
MDCDRFESLMLGELDGEVDDTSNSAAKQHLSRCARCSDLLRKLQATGRPNLPSIASAASPPVSLETRVPQPGSPLPVPPRRRLARVVSAAGMWAMRPQTAMAALFLVMIATSLLLLRERSSRTPTGSEMTVTEQGTPAPAIAPVASSHKALVPPPAGSDRTISAKEADSASLPLGRAMTEDAQPQAAADAKPAMPFETAMEAYRAKRFDEAVRDFDALAADNAEAALWAARALREAHGCKASVNRFDQVASRPTAGQPRWVATLEAAACYKTLGDVAGARERLLRLVQMASFRDRALTELSSLGGLPREAGGP